jgi:tetratricopeptide (TPR) repeat protein
MMILPKHSQEVGRCPKRHHGKRSENNAAKKTLLVAPINSEFSDNFVGEVPNYMVFAVTGEGGVGKSTLLKQFEVMAHSPAINAIVITCDDRYPTPVAVMGQIAGELAKHDVSHKEFDERYKKYRELRQEVESDPKMSRSAVNLLTMGLTDLTIKSLRKAPGVGVFFEYADEKAIGEAFTQFVDYGISRWGNKDEVQLLREPERILTPLFVELLDKASEKQRLILMFDVFERTGDTLSAWLLGLFNSEYGEFSTRLTFVVSGRDPLEQHWTDLAGDLCHMPLEPFTPDETCQYLRNRDITDEKLVAQIHDDTGGLPVLVELLAATNPQPGVPLPDISRDAVARFLQWTPQPERQRAALLAAVPRQFNRDILSAALGDDAAHLFNWLSTQSYIRTNRERGWFYHEKVRELMLRHLCNTTPTDLAAAHTRLAEFFAASQKGLDLQGKAAYDNEAWRKSECERVYHLVSAQPDRNVSVAINAFLHAFRWRRGFSESIAQIGQQVGLETGSKTIQDVAITLSETYAAYDQENWRIGIERLKSLEGQVGLTQTAHCEIYALRGTMRGSIREYDGALQDLNRAIELDKEYAWAIGSRGLTYQLMGQYESALADLTRAIQLDEKSAWAITNRGQTYRLMGQYESALADLTRAIQLDEKYAWAIAHRGETYRLMGQYEPALADFTCAIQLDEKYVWAIANRGRTYRQMGQYESALADLTRAIQLDEKSAWAIASRGETYRQMGQYESALADFTRAIQLDERYVWAIAHRGDTYRQMGKYESALADLTRAIQLNEKDTWAIANRGRTYRQMGRYECALTDFNRAIQLDEKYAWAIAHRGETYQAIGQYESALTDFTRAIQLDEKYAWAIACRGAIFLVMGKYGQALNDLDRAIALDDKDVGAIAGRGVTYGLMGKYDPALTDLNHVLALDEKNVAAIRFRGEIYRRLKEYGKALESFNQAIELSPRDAFSLCRRAATHLATNELEASQADLSRVLTLPLEDASDFYNRAVALVMTNKHNEAIEMLIQAFERKADERVYVSTDDLLDPIRHLPEFQELTKTT